MIFNLSINDIHMSCYICGLWVQPPSDAIFLLRLRLAAPWGFILIPIILAVAQFRP
jgi:hypothetical protein